MLKLSKDLSLPAEAVTQTFGLLAVRGAGKTNAARVMAEEMFHAGLPFVAVDPVGSWWGLRAGRDGGPGLSIPIFGGKHGDVPLEKTGGTLLADLVVDQRLSCVVDLSSFESEAAKKTFLLDFARRLYHRNESPLHLFLEEADDYIPQRPMRDEAQLLRAWENIVRRGRGRGLGMTMITQRSASINKNVLTQVQTLIAMRTTGPQDRKAVEEWLRYNDQSRDILSSLPTLEPGEAWVWSPQFLGKTVRIQFRLSTTFDSGATPKAGKAAKAPATLADVDLADLQQRMAATIEKAKADDPKELRKRIADLEKQLRAKPAAAVDPAAVDLAVASAVAERDRHWKGETAKSEAARKTAVGKLTRIHEISTVNGEAAVEIVQPAAQKAAVVPASRSQERRYVAQRAVPTGWTAARAPSSAAGDVRLGRGELAILTAAAQTAGGVTREQLTVLTGYRRSSRDTYLQRLKAWGLVDDGATVTATDAGLDVLGPDFEPLPTGDRLREHWLSGGRLGEGERIILEKLCEAYPAGFERAALDEATGYKRSSRDTYLQRLKSRKLVEDRGRGAVVASSILFG